MICWKMVTSRTIIKDQSDKMLDSVFWNKDDYRSNKVSKTLLNEVHSKLDAIRNYWAKSVRNA